MFCQRFAVCRFFLVSIIGIIFSAAVLADSGVQLYSDAWMDERFDWVIRIDPVMPGNYLQYPGSKLTPILCLKTFIRVNPSNRQGQSQLYIPYENLWYGNDHAIGCRRLMASLPLQPGWKGAIYISQSDLVDKQPSAFAHAVTKLMLDTGLCNCTVAAVLVSEDSIDSIADGMQLYGFGRMGMAPGEPNPDALTVLLTSGSASKLTTMLEGPLPNN